MSDRNTIESTRRLLLRGIASAKANEKSSARNTLERVLDLPATPTMHADAMYWLAIISENPNEKRDFIENVLALNPADPRALRLLAIVDGKLDPDAVIDPDFPPVQDNIKKQVSGERHVCPNCGGRLTFSPDGSILICEYCNSQNRIENDRAPQEHDFVVGMALAKGHLKPVAVQIFECKACGAVFQLSPEVLSLTCPHCDSAYTVIESETREVIPPEGIIPFAIPKKYAAQSIWRFLKEQGMKTKPHLGVLRGVYLPVWTFDFGGQANYTYRVYDNNNEVWENRTGSKLVHYDDIMIPASEPIPVGFSSILDTFNKENTISYEPSYTAAWLAETYKVTMSDAAIDARVKALAHAKPEVEKTILGDTHDLQLSSSGIIVEGYKLILVPIWISTYSFEGNLHWTLVNGNSGEAVCELPPTRLQKFSSWLLGDED